MKIKIGFDGMKKDASGEIYRFKKGIAVVPGIKIKRSPVFITLKEFNDLNQGESNGLH